MASTPLLFKDLESVRAKKSCTVSYFPLSLSATIFSAVISPTFLIADNPNKISPLATEKSSILKLMSGVFTFTPSSLASARNIAVLSLSLLTAVKHADRYSAG